MVHMAHITVARDDLHLGGCAHASREDPFITRDPTYCVFSWPDMRVSTHLGKPVLRILEYGYTHALAHALEEADWRARDAWPCV